MVPKYILALGLSCHSVSSLQTNPETNSDSIGALAGFPPIPLLLHLSTAFSHQLPLRIHSRALVSAKSPKSGLFVGLSFDPQPSDSPLLANHAMLGISDQFEVVSASSSAARDLLEVSSPLELVGRELRTLLEMADIERVLASLRADERVIIPGCNIVSVRGVRTKVDVVVEPLNTPAGMATKRLILTQGDLSLLSMETGTEVASGAFTHMPHKRTYKYSPKKPTEDRSCTSCATKVTPEWRRGPKGPKTLCNACGLQFAKKFGGKNLPVPSLSDDALATPAAVVAAAAVTTSREPSPKRSHRAMKVESDDSDTDWDEPKRKPAAKTRRASASAATSRTTSAPLLVSSPSAPTVLTTLPSQSPPSAQSAAQTPSRKGRTSSACAMTPPSSRKSSLESQQRPAAPLVTSAPPAPRQTQRLEIPGPPLHDQSWSQPPSPSSPSSIEEELNGIKFEQPPGYHFVFEDAQPMMTDPLFDLDPSSPLEATFDAPVASDVYFLTPPCVAMQPQSCKNPGQPSHLYVHNHPNGLPQIFVQQYQPHHLPQMIPLTHQPPPQWHAPQPFSFPHHVIQSAPSMVQATTLHPDMGADNVGRDSEFVTFCDD